MLPFRKILQAHDRRMNAGRSRRGMVISAVVFILSAGAQVAGHEFECRAADARAGNAAPVRPNIVFIMADDMGYSDAGCYGGEIETPVLNSLAENGLRFTQFYNTARCWPSRGVLLTGYYAQQIRRDAHFADARGRGQGQRPAWAPLLPQLLKPPGYRSYHSGKWHIDGKQLQNGFDRAYTVDDHDRFFYPRRHTQDDLPLPAVEPDAGYYATTAIASHAIRCLEEHAAEHSDRPFFQYIAFTAPHFPLHAPQADIDRYRRRYQQGWNHMQLARNERMKLLRMAAHEAPAMEQSLGPPYDFPKDLDRLGAGEVFRPLMWQMLTTEQQQFQAEKMAIHAAMVDRMDQEIGRIIEQLKHMNALDNTLLMFASDNGASAEIMVRGDSHQPDAAPGSGETFLCLGPGFSSAANTPFRRHKTWVHEGGISTPLIVHWPHGFSARNELRHVPTHLIDIVPTILEVAGATPPAEWNGVTVPPAPGKSLTPVFAADRAELHEDLWWCHDNHRAIRVGDWKLVAAHTEPWELYHLAVDRGESHDLATMHPQRVAELEERWLRRAAEFSGDSRRDE